MTRPRTPDEEALIEDWRRWTADTSSPQALDRLLDRTRRLQASQPRPCRNCGVETTDGRRRCEACRAYRNKYQVERPLDGMMPEPDPQGFYSSTDVAQLAEVSYRQLDYWLRTHRIEPARRGFDSGSRHRWTADDLERVKAIGARIEWGMTIDAAFRATDPPLPNPARGVSLERPNQ